MDAGDGHDVGAVLGVEVILIGLMGEVVGEDVAGFHHLVGGHIVGDGDHVQGDVLGSQDLLGDVQHFHMGHGGAAHGDGGAGQGGVVHIGIIAIGGLGHGGHGGAAVGVGDEVHHLLAGQGSHQSLGFGGLLVAGLDAQHVHIGGIGGLDQQALLHGIQAGVQGVVVVDNGVVHIGQQVGQHGGLSLDKLDAQGILGNVSLGGGDAGVLLQGDDAVGLQKQQGAALVGGVVGNGDGDTVSQGDGGGQNQNSSQQNGQELLHGNLSFLMIVWETGCSAPGSAPGRRGTKVRHIRLLSRLMLAWYRAVTIIRGQPPFRVREDNKRGSLRRSSLSHRNPASHAGWPVIRYAESPSKQTQQRMHMQHMRISMGIMAVIFFIGPSPSLKRCKHRTTHGRGCQHLWLFSDCFSGVWEIHPPCRTKLCPATAVT